MKVLHIAAKTLKETWRRPKNLALTLGIPLAFMVIFGLAFGGAEEDTYVVGAVNDDAGQLGAAYLDGLAGLVYDSGNALVLVIAEDSPDAGRDDVEARDIDVFVHLPSDFTAGLTPGEQEVPHSNPVLAAAGQTETVPAPPAGATVAMVFDPTFADGQAGAQIVEFYTQAFAQEAAGSAPAVTLDQETVATEDRNAFDFIAPGLMVFAILNLVPSSAATLAREVENGTMERIRLSPTGAAGLLGGVALAHMVLASVSLLLMIIVAMLMGFNNQGGLLAAYALALMAAVSVLGVGMIVAAFSKSQDEAANIGTAFSVPASFLSGAFFAVPGVTLFTIGSTSIGLYDILPTTHATRAMRSVMTFGDSLGDVTGSLLSLAVLSLVFFGVGVALFSWRRMRAE